MQAIDAKCDEYDSEEAAWNANWLAQPIDPNEANLSTEAAR